MGAVEATRINPMLPTVAPRDEHRRSVVVGARSYALRSRHTDAVLASVRLRPDLLAVDDGSKPQ